MKIKETKEKKDKQVDINLQKIEIKSKSMELDIRKSIKKYIKSRKMHIKL